MSEPKPKQYAPQPPELPPVDPDALEEAARRFINAKKPPGGWNRGAKKPRGEEGA